MLTASNIEKTFGHKKVLDGVHLTVHQGDVVRRHISTNG